MKKLIYITAIIGLCAFTQTSKDIVVKHHDYISYYNPAIKEADSVSYNLTAASVSCATVDRKNPFKIDPLIPGSASPNDYAVNSDKKDSPNYNADRASWIDEGHLLSYQSAMCSAFGIFECFYMTNMLPQVHAFNAGDWKTLEVQERVWAKTINLHEVAGGYGINTKLKNFPLGKLPNGEVIPAYMWKAIYMNGKYSVWIMPNQETSVGDKGLKTNKYTAWLTNIHTFDLQSIGNYIKQSKI